MPVYLKRGFMWADNEEELHEFADDIFLDRGYYMPARKQYFLADRYAVRAIQNGAVVVNDGTESSPICSKCGNRDGKVLFYRNGWSWVGSTKSTRGICYLCRLKDSERLLDELDSKVVICPRCKKRRYAFKESQGMCDKCFKHYNEPFGHGITIGQAEDILEKQKQ